MRQKDFKAYIESISGQIKIIKVYWATQKVKLESGFIVSLKRLKEIVASLPKKRKSVKKKPEENKVFKIINPIPIDKIDHS